MVKITQDIVSFLSNRNTSILIIFVCIIARTIQIVFYLDSFFDNTFQAIAAQNLLNGNGISTSIVHPSDLSNTIFQPLINWPPGYSLILSPFLFLSGGDHLIACLILNVLAAIAITLIARQIMKLLSISTLIINLFTLITSFFIYYFFFIGSTDAIAISFFLASIAVYLKAFKTNEKWLLRSTIAAILLLFCASLKYLFFPIVFVLPVLIYMYGFQNKLAIVKKGSLISIGILASGITAIYIYQNSISGAGVYISSPGRGFFPENVLHPHPFIPSSFVTLNSISKFTETISDNILVIFRAIHIIFFSFLIIIGIRHFTKSKLINSSIQDIFLYITLSVSITTSLVLAILSLFVEKELTSTGKSWTYLEDARYYGLLEILIHISLFLALVHYREKTNKHIKFILLILPFLLIPEALRGVIFTSKRILNYNSEEYYWQTEQSLYAYTTKVLIQKRDSLNVNNVIVTGSDNYLNYKASLYYNIPVMKSIDVLNYPEKIKSSKPVLLLALIRTENVKSFKGFIENSNTQFAGSYNNILIYTNYIAEINIP